MALLLTSVCPEVTLNCCMDVSTQERTNERTNKQTNERKNERTNEQTNERTIKRTNESTSYIISVTVVDEEGTGKRLTFYFFIYLLCKSRECFESSVPKRRCEEISASLEHIFCDPFDEIKYSNRREFLSNTYRQTVSETFPSASVLRCERNRYKTLMFMAT